MDTHTIVPGDYAVEFASPAWFDLYQKACIAACRMGRMADGVACEVYQDAPAHIAPDGTLAWTRRVEGGKFSFAFVECPDDQADSKIRADYATLLPLARVIIGEDESAFHRAAFDAVMSGKMAIVKRDPDAPANHMIHDLMAAWTR